MTWKDSAPWCVLEDAHAHPDRWRKGTGCREKGLVSVGRPALSSHGFSFIRFHSERLASSNPGAGGPGATNPPPCFLNLNPALPEIEIPQTNWQCTLSMPAGLTSLPPCLILFLPYPILGICEFIQLLTTYSLL